MNTGMGLRPKYYNDLLLAGDKKVPWLEAVTENFLNIGGSPRRILRKLRQDYPMALHGVGLSIGSLDPLREEYLKNLKTLIDETAPFLVSDHLSWTRHQGQTSHDLLPILYTTENLKRIAARVRHVQDFLGRKIYLENPSAYVEWRANEMSESEFLRDLCAMSGCGILLDVNNLVVNAHNLGADSLKYINDIRSVDVGQLHLGGHTRGEGLHIDTHDEAPGAAALELFRRARELWPGAVALLEWDDKLPEFSSMVSMIREIDVIAPNKIRADFSTSERPVVIQSDERSEIKMEASVLKAHEKFWSYLRSSEGLTEVQDEIAREWRNRAQAPGAGVHVYNSGYFARIFEVLQNVFPALSAAAQGLFPVVVKNYLMAVSPHEDNLDRIGERLPEFLRERRLDLAWGVDQRIYADIAALESARHTVGLAIDERTLRPHELHLWTAEEWDEVALDLSASSKIINLEYDIETTVENLIGGKAPPPPVWRPHALLVFRDRQLEIFSEELTVNDASIFALLKENPLLSGHVEGGRLGAEALFKFLAQYGTHFIINKKYL